MPILNAHQIRSQAAISLHEIAFKGHSANDVLAQYEFSNPNDTSLYKALVLGSCRYFLRMQAATEKLLRKPFKPKDRDLLCLLIVGLYQLEYTRIPDHAALSETVNACRELKKDWAAKLINGVLRNFVRQQTSIMDELNKNWDTKFSTPDWLINKIKPVYKGQIESILEASNQQAPMSLRVNLSKLTRQDYSNLLDEAGIEHLLHPLADTSIILNSALPVEQLPGFEEGLCSVQDAAAQMAAILLAPRPGAYSLDACAAPGGKTAHLLEQTNNKLHLDAVDIDPQRCFKIQENLERLELSADIHAEDALHFMQGKNGYYDTILLDVPCSATGVIRRHPDIKLLRREEDIAELVTIQQQLLESAWKALKPGGKLLYATCSILTEENSQQVSHFLKKTEDCQLSELPKELVNISSSNIGCQILPGTKDMDGFYYALLHKTA
ncbi:16S rRNA (cytosine(967)-C(5))-methyltransferase RsmB [Kangiella sediminilitoris]|uniref:16S rRNA (cytosine(967)-C(5))-methyltransferase n=1 Tax=Kangiella sediminilitoris TaxID=1144748 RepID=A0A1B3BDX1_9GAMM|nr:16S rRNA (cytosine(967)-C(5))-methyltransferase RsmB [Kangiella sediminilitoris]AOE51012.1 Ribosomal RNA small subunit methyltransferase B [Kangiella sediminilitoris]